MIIEQQVCFEQTDVAAYRRLIGIREHAGHLILPPMMPALAYKQLTIPWQYTAPVILRKQQTRMIAALQADQCYMATLQVIDVKVRGKKTMLKEVLQLREVQTAALLFESISELVTGGVADG